WHTAPADRCRRPHNTQQNGTIGELPWYEPGWGAGPCGPDPRPLPLICPKPRTGTRPHTFPAPGRSPVDSSVSAWIDRLKDGDPAAAQPLWERYFGRLVGLARDRLRGAARRAADEEDVALSAFDSFCRGAA